MSSPAAAPTPASMGFEASKRQVTRPTTSAATDVSTPAAHPTPSSTGLASTFLSPSAGRVSGKSLGKTLPGQHASPPAVGMSTPNLGSLAAQFDSPSMLAMEPSSSAMGLSMSGLGFSGSALGGSNMGRLDDAERRRRLENVLTTLNQRPGRVSQESVQRLARKLGMEMYSETTETHELMTLAGGVYAVDLLFQPNGSPIVDNVELHFHGLQDTIVEQAPAAASILLKQLNNDSSKPSVNVMLDGFAENLEKLYRLDRLSVAGASCFEAVAGVHASLQRLYEHEKKMAETLNGEQPRASTMPIDTEVMCKRRGRPRMHARRRVGLSLEYWQKKHTLLRNLVEPSDTEMDLDKPSTATPAPVKNDEDNDIYSLNLDCEYCPPALYPSIRISNDWLSPQIIRPPDSPNESLNLNPLPIHDQLDWTEPLPPLISTVEPDPISTSANTESTQPRARFVATLEPPLILPVSVAIQIYASVGVDIMPDLAQTQAQAQQLTYDGLLLGHDRLPETQKTVMAFDTQGVQHDEIWETRFYVARPELGREVASIPFAHPRQLLPILPILRQYALFGTLLRSVTSGATPASSAVDTTIKPTGPSLSQKQKRRRQQPNPRDELDALLSSSPPPGPSTPANDSQPSIPRILDTTLIVASPIPRLSVVIPSAEGPHLFGVEVHANGEIIVTWDAPEVGDNVNVDGDGVSESVLKRNRGFARGLGVCEDVVVWAEWLQWNMALGIV